MKPDGTIRICVDYRGLNSITQHVQWFMLLLDYIVEKDGSAKVLSKLDLIGILSNPDGRHECRTNHIYLPIWKISDQKNAIWVKKPFGLKNASAVFPSVLEKS